MNVVHTDNTANKIDVSIIIVNYNTKVVTQKCIESVIDKTKAVSYEIILVDNASSDGSVEAIKEKNYPFVKIIENKGNFGFGRANNIGVKVAKGKYILFLNSDTILLNDAVSLFFRTAEEKENIILGCYLQDLDGNFINSYSGFEDRKHILVRSLYLYLPWLLKIRKQSTNNIIEPIEKNVDFITGADLFIRKEDFDRLHGFDAHFFMYCEDEDLCLRARKIGIQCRVITEPKIIHLEGKSSKVSSVKRKIILQSYKYYIGKNL